MRLSSTPFVCQLSVTDSLNPFLYPEMRKSLQAILRHTPHEKQVMMFSATMGPDTSGTCKKFMHQVLYLPTSPSLSLFSLPFPFSFPLSVCSFPMLLVFLRLFYGLDGVGGGKNGTNPLLNNDEGNDCVGGEKGRLCTRTTDIRWR